MAVFCMDRSQKNKQSERVVSLSASKQNFGCVFNAIIGIIIIIIIIMSLFYEDNIFSTITNLTYGPRLKKQQKHDNHNTIFTIYT